MKYTFAAMTALLILGGCSAEHTSIMTPQGDAGYTIDCSGEFLDWGACYKKAGALCGAKGYRIIDRAGDTGGTVLGSHDGIFGDTIVTRTLVIACKNPKGDR